MIPHRATNYRSFARFQVSTNKYNISFPISSSPPITRDHLTCLETVKIENNRLCASFGLVPFKTIRGAAPVRRAPNPAAASESIVNSAMGHKVEHHPLKQISKLSISLVVSNYSSPNSDNKNFLRASFSANWPTSLSSKFRREIRIRDRFR